MFIDNHSMTCILQHRSTEFCNACIIFEQANLSHSNPRHFLPSLFRRWVETLLSLLGCTKKLLAPFRKALLIYSFVQIVMFTHRLVKPAYYSTYFYLFFSFP